MITQEADLLLQLIKSTLYGGPVAEAPEAPDYKLLYQMARRHAVEVMAYQGLQRLNTPPEKEIMARFQEKYLKQVAQDTINDYAMEQILEAFEAAGIDCMPLKGYVIRHLYPRTEMRYLSDFDLLVDPGKKEQSREVMRQLGYQPHRYDTHHDIFYSLAPMMNVELHKFLMVGKLGEYFGVGFERAMLQPGRKHLFTLSTEDYYIYILGHMAYHFAHGGIGIRSIVDIRVYLDCYGRELNWEYLRKELRRCGLLRFAEALSQLSEIWFLGKQEDALMEQLSEYILDSEVLGTQEASHVLEAVMQYQEDGNISAAKKRAVKRIIFLPAEEMKFLYPVLTRIPALLPMCHLYRWGTVLLCRRKNVGRLFKTAGASKEEILKLKRLYRELEINHL